MKEFFLKSLRIGFSTWNIEDLKDAIELWGNPEVTKFITSTGVMSHKDIESRLQKEIATYNNYKVQYFPIYLLRNLENIGCCGLRPYDIENNIYEVGIHLKPEYWGLGLASEALNSITHYAFNSLNIKELFAGHNPYNKSSEALLKKIGFNYLRDEFYKPTGLYHPSYSLKNDK
ncbi:GNAT family N-acetyltransferase [Clostridium intestinale]|uniref:GNAT family N-acetyltransferase n=1 Tax=Clostridium intestinale TaxID=36845 RepID=UPI0028E6AA05|nr:GNAT family N-acetyltransferase [Clostridium intestinale]